MILMCYNIHKKNVTIQNPSPYIRKTARFTCFLAALQLILLIYGAVTLSEPPYELDNQPLTCKHDDSDYLILRGSE